MSVPLIRLLCTGFLAWLPLAPVQAHPADAAWAAQDLQRLYRYAQAHKLVCSQRMRHSVQEHAAHGQAASAG